MVHVMKCHIKGLVPTLMCGNKLANPLDPLAIKYAELSSKAAKKRTQSDNMELLRLQFFGALYVDAQERVCWPGENIESMFLAAAKKFTKGPKCKIGLFVDGAWPLIYDGPKNANDLWDDPRFRFIRTIINRKTGGTALSCSPRFDIWALKFEVNYDDGQLDKKDVENFLEKAGCEVGLSGWRPKFGRFEVVK